MNTFQTLKEFYPTPAELIVQMLNTLDDVDVRNYRSILDPSAGKGDLTEFLSLAASYIGDPWRYKFIDNSLSFDEKVRHIIHEDVLTGFKEGNRAFRHSYNIECVELNKDLATILRDKDYIVHQEDFLQYEDEKHYDLIIMNPPFSNGDEHLLHAIDIAKKTGSEIVCLLNAETIRNPYTNRRKELQKQLEKYKATYQYISNAFSNAERKTDVEVVIVHLTIPSPFVSESRIWNELENFEVEIGETDIPSEMIAADDTLKMAVKLYHRELEAGKKLITEYLSLKPYLSSKFDNGDTSAYLSGCTLYLSNGNDQKLDWNKYVFSVRYKYWYQLLHEPTFMQNLTSNLKDEYFNMIHKFAERDFSLRNIYTVKMDILERVSKGIEDKIVSLFEKLSYEHSMGCEKNIHYFNGWKSNSAFKINEKVVIPYLSCWNDIRKKFDYDYRLASFFDDIEKCLDFLSLSDNGGSSNLNYLLRYYESIQQTRKLRLKYFDVDVFKKGTVHIKFRDPELLKRFNLYGCQRKSWLPPSYGKKPYSEMTTEEKAVIDEYEGEEEYTKVYENPEKYILTPEKTYLSLTSSIVS